MNYIIEGNINFYDELKKDVTLISEKNNVSTVDNNIPNIIENSIENSIENNKAYTENTCLISGKTLNEKNIITLECNHVFNYESLYNEIIRQKRYVNYNEITRLTINQIKCPYCRNIQDKLLPYFSDAVKVHGVNYPLKHCMYLHTCNYTYKSGKKIGEFCNKKCNTAKCNLHEALTNKNILDNNSQLKCNKILISGKNIGNTCNCKIYKDNLCRRHFKLV